MKNKTRRPTLLIQKLPTKVKCKCSAIQKRIEPGQWKTTTKKEHFKLFVSFTCQLISGSVVFWTADFHFITMIALRESLKGSQCFHWLTHTHTHTHFPESPIPLWASHCLHGQSTSSNQLKTALSSWSMAEVGVGQDEDRCGWVCEWGRG